MFAPISILKTFVDIKDPEYIANRLSINGLETSIKKFSTNIENIKVGEIISIQNLQNLKLCKVFVGNETLDIITSASNIYKGAKVPVALPGAKLNGTTIDTKAIKGFTSQGMLLSASELGFEDIEEGILILDEDVSVGEDVSKILDFGEIVFECETTPNRGDLLSIIGIAREIAVITKSYLDFDIKPDIDIHTDTDIDINIETDGCHQYVGTLLKNATIRPSRLWLRKALWKMGIKSISNVIDITNYTMLLLGQPLHAFDKNKLNDSIYIRQAKEGESIIALDKKEYMLDSSVMVIADKKVPIAIAGIIGGLESAISFDTKDILLESALFEPVFVRKASKLLKITTDASYRFERGIDTNMTYKASLFACDLIAKESGATIQGLKNISKNNIKPKKFFLPMNDYIRYTDSSFDRKELSDILSSLSIKHNIIRCGIEFEVPSHRYYDINSGIDIIEEIVRVKDFNSFESSFFTLTPRPHLEKDIISDVKHILVSNGLTEVVNLSFDKIEDYEELGLSLPLIEIKNPILPSFRFLRRYLTPSIIRVAKQNKRKHIEDFAIFEISHVFDEDREHLHLCMLLKGLKRDYPATKWSIYHIKELVHSINKALTFGFSDYKFLHPYKQGQIKLEGEKIGFFGMLNNDILEDSLICEFRLYTPKSQKPKIRISKYPPVVRDISLILDMDFDIQKLIITIQEYLIDMLEDIKIFDFYKGEQIEEDKKSIGLRLVLRGYDRSLEDDEVNNLMKGLLEYLEAFGVKLRFSEFL